MANNNRIYYLRRNEIDVLKWDACISQAANGLIYAYSFYLDAMCTNWDALVINDYEDVVPLPWRKKWGIKYVYQPAFIQRLGIFGNASHPMINNVYQEALKYFSFIHYNISQPLSLSKVKRKERKNFIIDLNKNYGELTLAYDKECHLNIKKAKERGCIFSQSIEVEELITGYRAAYGLKNSNLKNDDYERFLHLLHLASKTNSVELAGVKNQEGKVIYTAAILRDTKRLYYILGAPTEEGRKKRATYFFIDHLLKNNSQQHLLFDFEGSDIPNVSNFYEKFGPGTEYYYEIKSDMRLKLFL